MSSRQNIHIKNIYYMLAYAFHALRQNQYASLCSEKFDNIHNLFAAILSIAVGSQVKRGLYREYRNFSDNVIFLKGRINIYGTIKNKLSRKSQAVCEFNDLTENNILNQIIKTAVVLLITHGNVDGKYKNILKRHMLFFSGVDTIDQRTICWERICFFRNNITYQMILGICQLLLNNLLISDSVGKHSLANFIDERAMHTLYEKFILEYYRKHFPFIKVSDAKVQWFVDDGFRKMLPSMQTDIFLEYGDNILIIDAKYYGKTLQSQFGNHTIHSHNLYQIFTYVKNASYRLENAHKNVSGMLLYAKTSALIQPNNSYMMHGNKITVTTLDLHQDFSKICGQLDSIVLDHFGQLTTAQGAE